MEIIKIILLLIIVFMLFYGIFYTRMKVSAMNEILREIYVCTADLEIDEYDVKLFTKLTTFRIVPKTNSLNEKIWNIEYRNPAGTRWKTCRCMSSCDEAYKEMLNLIKRINNGEFENT